MNEKIKDKVGSNLVIISSVILCCLLLSEDSVSKIQMGIITNSLISGALILERKRLGIYIRKEKQYIKNLVSIHK